MDSLKPLTQNDHEAEFHHNNQNKNVNKNKATSKVMFLLEQEELNGIARENCNHLADIARSMNQIKYLLAWLLEETMRENYVKRKKENSD